MNGHDKSLEELRLMGFSFHVSVPARFFVGRELRSPRFRVPRLWQGLAALRRLRAARLHQGRGNRYTFRPSLHLALAWQRLKALGP